MKSLFRKAAAFASALGFALVTGAASATPIVIDQWYEFGFFGGGGDPLASGAGTTPGLLSIQVGAPAWTFTCASACTLVVTDGFLAVDQFELFDSGSSLGSTSAPTGGSGHSCSNNEVACLADPLMSHGSFLLAAGDHTITGTHLIGAPGAGVLYRDGARVGARAGVARPDRRRAADGRRYPASRLIGHVLKRTAARGRPFCFHAVQRAGRYGGAAFASHAVMNSRQCGASIATIFSRASETSCAYSPADNSPRSRRKRR